MKQQRTYRGFYTSKDQLSVHDCKIIYNILTILRKEADYLRPYSVILFHENKWKGYRLTTSEFQHVKSIYTLHFVLDKEYENRRDDLSDDKKYLDNFYFKVLPFGKMELVYKMKELSLAG